MEKRLTTQRVPGVAAATEKPAIPATTTKTRKTASGDIRLASLQRYEQFLETTRSNRNEAAAGRNLIATAAMEKPACRW